MQEFSSKWCHTQWNMKTRSRSPGHRACMESMSRTISIQGWTLTAIFAEETEKCTIPSRIMSKSVEHESRSGSWGHSACSKSMQRTISMQGWTVAAVLLQRNALLSRFMSNSHENEK